MPYVPASGQYDVNLMVPGCQDFQDCDLRTSVDIAVFPGGNQQPWVTTVSQRNQRDSVTNIYNDIPSSRFDLFNALGGSTNLFSSGAFVNSVVQHRSGILFPAGGFSLTSGTALGAPNIVAFGGVLLIGNRLYVGGRFTDTTIGSTNGATCRSLCAEAPCMLRI